MKPGAGTNQEQRMNMLSAVIFDFDGIIVDSEPMHFRTFNKALTPLNLDVSWEDYLDSYVGFDDLNAFRIAFKKNGREICNHELLKLIEQKAGFFQQAIGNGEARPLPGAVELVQSLSAHLPVALCSGALREDVDAIMTRLGIADCFTVIVTAEDTDQNKPDPAPYQLTLDQLGIDAPETAIAIEDTPVGILSAKGAGLKVLAVTNSFSRTELLEADALTGTLETVSRSTLENIVFQPTSSSMPA